MENFAKDIGYAIRSLKKKPAFALISVATLGVGLGASTAIFSVVNAVLLRNLPYQKPSELVLIWERFGGPGFGEPILKSAAPCRGTSAEKESWNRPISL